LSLLRLELDPAEIDDPFVVGCRGETSEHRCETCRTTWFDPVAGPLAVDVDAPDGPWDLLAPGSMPGADTPLLVVAPAVAEALRDAGIDGFAAHPVTVETVDGEPGYDGPEWVALWPTGRAAGVYEPGDGDAVEPCSGCARYSGEFETDWSWGLTEADCVGDLLALPGWRYTLFATPKAWAAIQAAGVQFLRAVPVPTR